MMTIRKKGRSSFRLAESIHATCRQLFIYNLIDHLNFFFAWSSMPLQERL